MRRILAFFGGVLSGGAIGTAVALLFTPQSGDVLREGLRSRYTRAIKAGETAAALKRAELEAKLNGIAGLPSSVPDQEG